MSKDLPSFSVLGSLARPERVKELLNSATYEPIAALFTLSKQLSGPQKKLLDKIWEIAMTAAQDLVKSSGYTSDELTAALAVTCKGVAPPE